MSYNWFGNNQWDPRSAPGRAAAEALRVHRLTEEPRPRQEPRNSTETDRRALLDTASTIAPSESASRATSIYGDGDRTPRAQSPQRRSTVADPSNAASSSYRGFPSEAHYLAALKAWVDEKKYLQPDDNGLKGYYGETTAEEYASRPKMEFGLSKKWKARKERRAEEARRKSAV